MQKLCYVIPEYAQDTREHYYHIYELLEDLSQELDIFLVIIKSWGKPDFKRVNRIYIRRFPFPLSVLELLLVFSYARLKGYRSFYVHQSSWGGVCSSLVVKLFGGQTFWWHCGLIKMFMTNWSPSFKKIKRKLLNDCVFLLNMKLVSYLVTGTESMADYYTKNFGRPRDKIRVMPNWVDLERFDSARYSRELIRKELNIRSGARVVLFVHWLSPRKGTGYLPDIAQMVLEKVPGTFFLVVGDGPSKKELEREVRERGLDGTVRILGSMPNKDIAGYYSVADVFIMPSLEEGFPRVLLESMAMGVPFVATDVGGVMDIVSEKQKEFVVPPKDMQLFAERIVALLQSPDMRSQLAEEGLRHVKQFSKERVKERFLEIVGAER